MKSAPFVSCVALAMLLAAGQLGAQSRGQFLPKMRVDVPFDFMVGNVMFPAGNYTVRPLKNRTFRLRAIHGRESVSIAMKPIRPGSHPRSPSLIFAKEDRHYQLRELWMNPAIGVEVPGPGADQLHTVRESGEVEVPASCTSCE